MATFTRWVWNFTTPTIRFAGQDIALRNFTIDIPMGGVANHGVDRHSMVLGSITELAAAPGTPFDFPFVGSAGMNIRNISPRCAILDAYL